MIAKIYVYFEHNKKEQKKLYNFVYTNKNCVWGSVLSLPLKHAREFTTFLINCPIRDVVFVGNRGVLNALKIPVDYRIEIP